MAYSASSKELLQGMSQEVRECFEHIFDVVDSDRDGYITRRDIEGSMAHEDGLTDVGFKARHILACFDMDQDGKISRREWLTSLASFPAPTGDQLAEFQRQFRRPS